MQLLQQYFELQEKIHQYFGYTEDWKVIPMDDSTIFYWKLTEYEDGTGYVRFHETEEALKPENEDEGKYYENEIHTQRFLPKLVYRAEDYTMICVDTHTDGNKFLQIFDNSKEIKDAEDE